LDLGWLRALPPLHHAATPQAALVYNENEIDNFLDV